MSSINEIRNNPSTIQNNVDCDGSSLDGRCSNYGAISTRDNDVAACTGDKEISIQSSFDKEVKGKDVGDCNANEIAPEEDEERIWPPQSLLFTASAIAVFDIFAQSMVYAGKPIYVYDKFPIMLKCMNHNF